MRPWIIKYIPKKLSDISGQKTAISQIESLLSDFKKGKALLLYGSTGVGKTSAAVAYAKDNDLELIEMNASDVRNKASIEEFLNKAVCQMSLFAKGKIILVDEVDGLSGTKDRGGIPALVKQIKKSTFPIILTCQNAYDRKLSALKKTSHLVEFQHLSYIDVYNRLSKICENEKVKFDEKALKALSRRAGGDMRAAINDLQSLATDGVLTKEDLDSLSDRKQKESLSTALVKILKTTNADIARTALDNVDENLDKVLLWLDENLPSEYTKPKDLIRAYDRMSKADVYKGRIRRWQHWRFLVYMNALLTSGVAISKDEKYPDMINLVESKRPLKIWMANMKYMKRKGIAEKVAALTHASTRDTIQEVIPYIAPIFTTPKGKAFQEFFDLDNDEVAWLKKTAQ